MPPGSWAKLLARSTQLSPRGKPFSSKRHVLGRQQRSTYTHVRLALLAPSGLVWRATWPRTTLHSARDSPRLYITVSSNAAAARSRVRPPPCPRVSRQVVSGCHELRLAVSRRGAARIPRECGRADGAARKQDPRGRRGSAVRLQGRVVPGVTVYGWLTHPIVEALGAEWLEKGSFRTRFTKPIYFEEPAVIRARVTARTGDSVIVEAAAHNAAGDVCGTAQMSLSRAPRAQPPDAGAYATAAMPG